jgi:hypothetical protein
MLKEFGLDSMFVGCASMTFPRYDGPREGVLSVDFDGPGARRTHFIDEDSTWCEKWDVATSLLGEYRTAKVVYTTRLHVALPCLAFGTPVFLAKNSDARRFSVFDAAGGKYEEPCQVDVSKQVAVFEKFLAEHAGVPMPPGPPAFSGACQ